MNKEILKRNWGKYTDTDKLVDDITELLEKFHHKTTEHGVCMMLDEYFINKEPLIKLFKKSPNYIGNMRIAEIKEFERENNEGAISSFCCNFPNDVGANCLKLKATDDGKTIVDMLKVGKKRINVDALESEKLADLIYSVSQYFDNYGFTHESNAKFDDFVRLINLFNYWTRSNITDNFVKSVQNIDNSIKCANGMKTSRLFNRICDKYGITKLEQYNKLFAQYADLVSDSKRNLKFIISLNPYDYLTMSFGKTWASCHTIDKRNERNMSSSYSGAYCGGTLSYMLDTTSIITYVLGREDDVQTSGKIYRNMFHFNVDNKILVQGRVYPQGNDGATDLYKKIRGFMQDELASLIELDSNMWRVKKGIEYCGAVVESEGVHYRDYLHYDNCNVSYPVEASIDLNNETITIGHYGICPYCGDTIESESMVVHYDCIADEN